MAGEAEEIKDLPAGCKGVVVCHPAVFDPSCLREHSGLGYPVHVAFYDGIGIHEVINDVGPAAAFPQEFKGPKVQETDNEHNGCKGAADPGRQADGHDKATQDKQGRADHEDRDGITQLRHFLEDNFFYMRWKGCLVPPGGCNEENKGDQEPFGAVTQHCGALFIILEKGGCQKSEEACNYHRKKGAEKKRRPEGWIEEAAPEVIILNPFPGGEHEVDDAVYNEKRHPCGTEIYPADYQVIAF